ncbi:MAG: NADPH:quinone oxidoreductase family protein [Gammaproteobacteria bacterium]
MKAQLCKEFGPPETLVLEEIPDPVAEKGQVVVDIEAAGVNYPDALMIAGKYQFRPPFPFAPGGEIAGTIAAIGEGVTEFKIGDRVMGLCGNGAFAEKIAIPAASLMPIPAQMSSEKAAGFSMVYGTSWYALKQRANLQPSEVLLVLGAGGGVGVSAVELGKAVGAQVIAAASSDEKLQVAQQAGADHLINYSDGELKEKVKALTNGKGADVIYDPVGGDLFNQCLRCVNWNGRILVIGFTGGIPQIPTNLVLLKGCQIVGVFWGAFTQREPDTNAANFAELFEMFSNGRIDPPIHHTFSLENTPAAIKLLADRKATGKIVIKPR